MGNDAGWKAFLSDDERYADIINGIGCKGRQMVKKEDLKEMDTQTGVWHGPAFIRRLPVQRKRAAKIRDSVRKAAFGMNFVVVGIENQETIDYSIPLRDMSYGVGEYERQAAKIRKEVRKNHSGLRRGEYLYGFRKESRLHPSVTILLYYGEEPWDGPVTLHEMLDFTDIPQSLKEMTADHRINLVEIRKLKDTSIFHTDVRHVFEFIRCSENKDALKALVEGEEYFRNMEEDAFDVVLQYVNGVEQLKEKDYYRKDGKVDMCTAIKEWMAEERKAGLIAGREEGMAAGRQEEIVTVVTNMLRRGMSDETIMAIAECDRELIDQVRNQRV